MRILSLMMTVTLAISAYAADFDPLSVTIDRNMAYPEVPARASAKVAAAMRREAAPLMQAHFKVSFLRNGEVMLVTVTASQLFNSNATDLATGADATLRAILPTVARASDFKVLVAVHTDDTGDVVYSDSISSGRANAIDDYFYTRLGAAGSEHIIPYGLGRDEPLAGNNSMAGRAKNRRVEFYFVPTREYIEAARRRH